jgi:hypothetical protein
MRTFKITGSTNGYIASRDIIFNGKTQITLATGLSLEQARKKLDDFFLEDYGHQHDSFEVSYNEATEESVYGNDDRWTDYKDGTASYEYDSRYYRIQEETEE